MTRSGANVANQNKPTNQNKVDNSIVSATVSHTKHESRWEAPIPRPVDLDAYAKILPDAPERIFAMVEREAAHRHICEQKIVDTEVKLNNYNAMGMFTGQISGILLALAAMFFAFLNERQGGNFYVSVAFVALPVMSVARSLIDSYRKK